MTTYLPLYSHLSFFPKNLSLLFLCIFQIQVFKYSLKFIYLSPMHRLDYRFYYLQSVIRYLLTFSLNFIFEIGHVNTDRPIHFNCYIVICDLKISPSVHLFPCDGNKMRKNQQCWIVYSSTCLLVHTGKTISKIDIFKWDCQIMGYVFNYFDDTYTLCSYPTFKKSEYSNSCTFKGSTEGNLFLPPLLQPSWSNLPLLIRYCQDL